MASFFGKYRGKIVNNIDPLMLGRVSVVVPTVSEFPLSWAMPCAPYAGKNVGFFTVPPIDANVWVEFEQGDLDYPIWTGCFWAEGEVPAGPALPTTKVLKTETVTLEINDLLTSVSLQVLTPAGPVKLEQGPEGIALTIGSASLKVSLQAIDFAMPPSTLSIGPEGISLKNGASDINLSPASIEIKNGAASVALTPVTVSLNNGALEVM